MRSGQGGPHAHRIKVRVLISPRTEDHHLWMLQQQHPSRFLFFQIFFSKIFQILRRSNYQSHLWWEMFKVKGCTPRGTRFSAKISSRDR
jgi:hypothetical protein